MLNESSKSPLPSFLIVQIAGLILISGLLTPVIAQSSSNDVHVVPRIGVGTTSGTESSLMSSSAGKAIRVSADLVLIPVTVTDPMNRIVLGLGSQDFEVYDGKQSQEIKHFSQEDAPVSLGIILDSSGSMKSKMDRAREAVSIFLNTANPQDEFFLISFADRPQEVADFSPSIGGIQTQLLTAVPKGRTALLDAVYMGINKMKQGRYQRRALLIISDGGDNHSRYSENELKSLVKEADVMIYAIGVYDHFFASEEELLGPSLLSDITAITGGRAFTIDNPNDLPAVARRIGVELRDQYVIGYRPAAPHRDGKWHKIKVHIRQRKHFPTLRAYAKTGYYAPAE